MATQKIEDKMEQTEFLLARIDEDEGVARKAAHLKVAGPLIRWHSDSAFLMRNDMLESVERRHIARFDPARVLAECEAKRRIVNAWRAGFPDEDRYAMGWHDAWLNALMALALPYVAHEDYREEWAL